MQNPQESPTELTAGVTLNRGYRIVKKLGEGGMGRVYEAEHIELGRACALKQTFYSELEQVKWFKNEAQLLSRLRHRSLPHVDDYFEEGGSYFLAMDLIGGESLKIKLAAQLSIDASIVLEWAGQILDALSYLHTQPKSIIHRDIKPDNIKVDGDNAYLVDFGLAKEMTSGTLVQAHTPDYASPEQIHPGRRTDPRSDIYSFGATLHHLITGQLPSRADERDRALQDGEQDPFQGTRQSNNAINEALAAAIDQALAFDPNMRFQTAREMASALEDVNKASQHFAEGLSYHREGHYDDAIREFREALKRQPDHAESFLGIGKAYVKKKQYRLAIENLNEAIDLNPNLPDVYYFRGFAFHCLNELPKALNDYTEAIKLEPRRAWIYHDRGVAHSAQHNFGLAIQDYSQAIRLQPNRSEFLSARAWVYQKIGRRDLANADYSQAEQLAEPNFKWLTNILKLILNCVLALVGGVVSGLAILVYDIGASSASACRHRTCRPSPDSSGNGC